LNDEIINFYGALISERAARFEDGKEKENGKEGMASGKGKEKINGRDYPSDDGVGDPWKVHVFNTYFLAKLQDLGYEKAKLNKWTKKVRCSICSLRLDLIQGAGRHIQQRSSADTMQFGEFSLDLCSYQLSTKANRVI
jgi:hypothetical protein